MGAKSIYFTNEIYDRVCRYAEENEWSISKAVEKLLLVGLGDVVDGQIRVTESLGRIESKLDQIICGFGDFPVKGLAKDAAAGGKEPVGSHKPDIAGSIPVAATKKSGLKLDKGTGEMVYDPVIPEETDEIKAANERLLKKREEAKNGFFNPQPKDKLRGGKTK